MTIDIASWIKERGISEVVVPAVIITSSQSASSW